MNGVRFSYPLRFDDDDEPFYDVRYQPVMGRILRLVRQEMMRLDDDDSAFDDASSRASFALSVVPEEDEESLDEDSDTSAPVSRAESEKPRHNALVEAIIGLAEVMRRKFKHRKYGTCHEPKTRALLD